ncbi:MAG: 16S rRNA (guanine(966)-N(2))-methyltransferase RsmD [Verrucomicrobia bacterium]|nr:16S rRNA (guanine(966)-N(2))-methyltransferase RsmD [Verrucomicrobiota bacterium]MDA0858033.1 16S rRNA (guanine(966)-N(2))-methyltransferase RsmD [Verrucomicrobiota bacterium]MDA1339730.1 16S rRNA (guanine(966)-N(2))-methyltransferase RsmD [Verrucomicrobiota bacterium]
MKQKPSKGHREEKPPCHSRRGGGFLRITAGIHRSRQLIVPPLPGLRPAQDRVRAAVFSALGALVPESRVLDLFAGTGAYGIEALSRGAQSALFIEQNTRTADALRENLTSLHYSFPVLATAVENWLPQATGLFDLIFLDPPYDQTGAELSQWKVIQGLERLLAPGGRIVWEHHTSSKWSPAEPLQQVWHRTYGRSSVSFLAAPDLR